MPVTSVMATQYDAHIHGVAEISIVMEGKELHMQLHSPADTLVGFEHKAQTQQQKQAVQTVDRYLNTVNKIVEFTGNKCNAVEIEVDVTALLPEEHGHDEHEHEHDKHAHEHDKHTHEHDEHEHKHDKHEHEHEHDGHERSDTHIEITANYQFLCDDITEISAIQIKLFEQFPALEKVQAIWIGPNGQNAQMLSKNDNSIKLN
ncbi:ZrgA family zinc uptake protein [Catenovulum agarivorans]|nr:DUF2796 domain-containing protein [Catenovulum agarivorans]